jgi:hypothetical protein
LEERGIASLGHSKWDFEFGVGGVLDVQGQCGFISFPGGLPIVSKQIPRFPRPVDAEGLDIVQGAQIDVTVFVALHGDIEALLCQSVSE